MTNHTMYVIYCSTRIKNKIFTKMQKEVCDMMKKDARNLYYIIRVNIFIYNIIRNTDILYYKTVYIVHL